MTTCLFVCSGFQLLHRFPRWCAVDTGQQVGSDNTHAIFGATIDGCDSRRRSVDDCFLNVERRRPNVDCRFRLSNVAHNSRESLANYDDRRVSETNVDRDFDDSRRWRLSSGNLCEFGAIHVVLTIVNYCTFRTA
jgi:hypothetical protein